MTYDDLLNRVAKLEHALRRASEKFGWLAKYHVDEFARKHCDNFANEFWSTQAGEGVRVETEFSWLVENGKSGDELRYRTMDQGAVIWTADPHAAIRFSRRADAEMFAAEDEDAWRIVQHGFDVPAGNCDCARDFRKCPVHGQLAANGR